MLQLPKNTLNLASIVAKASTLTERLNNSFIPIAADRDDTQIEARLQWWCQVVAKGDLVKLQRRLAWDELDFHSLRSLLGNVQNNEHQALPSWAMTLEQVVQTAQSLSHQELFSPHRFLDPTDPLPFETVYVPCLRVAQNLLETQVGSRLELLSIAARVALEKKLAYSLAVICSSTLMKEFSEFRSSGDPLHDFLLLRAGGSKRQEKYRVFIQKLFQDGLVSLFEEYSVLGRLVATAINFWVEATVEFLNSLVTDWSDIERCFCKDLPIKQVVTIKPGLSDPHNRGRTVMAITFDSGMQLVYKPKDLSLDVAFYEFLDWCNSYTAPLPFKILQVLNHSTHGWVEYVESLPCADELAVQRYYQRSGMLLCLMHLLEGVDCHYENLIANGEHPVLVDLETLLCHRTKKMEAMKSDASVLADQLLDESVLRSLLLPQWGLQPNDQLTLDMSGLGGVEEQALPLLKFKNINTDAMDVGYETITLQQKGNTPTLNGIPLSPEDYIEDLVAGFEQMYHQFIIHQAYLLAPDSPLMILARQKVRYVFRATNTYSFILQRAYHPDLLRFGIDRSIGLDVLSRAFLTAEDKPLFWPILAAELQAMEQLDVPFLIANSSSDCLVLPTGVIIPKLFEEPSWERVLLRFQTLSEADLTQQVEIIRGSFYSRFIQEPNLLPDEVVTKVSSVDATVLVTREQLVQQAIRIAEDLKQRAICGADGSVTWMGLRYKSNKGFQLKGLGENLYDGSFGTALFLAALAKVTGNCEWHDLCIKTLQPPRNAFQDSNHENVARLTRVIGISGATGLASIAYSLIQISKLLQEPVLLQDTLKVVSLMEPELITADRTFDIMSGVAGTILGLLAVSESTSLELAVTCGVHLLEHQTSINNRPKSWKNSAGKQLTGFSQGAAGIAYALLRLYAVTQDSRFLNAAQEAIAYEQSVFCAEAQNWPDLRSEEPCFRVSWANGAAGIGLGRLGGLSILNTQEIRQEIAIAVETTQKFAISDLDNLCWGNLGRIETLLVAAQKLDRPDLLEFIHQAVTHVVTQAEYRGTFTFFSDLPPKVYNPGFFHGATGIGYELLRIAYPNLLPSILLWE